jgi:(1->4)-alpha-D-glucan 1-alpha-D-glucosylmutase
MSWREAPKQLSWRRFFEITGLVGVRVEDDAVFDDTHRLILELVHAGVVDGLRIDHVDGLADPLGYLQRLRQKTGPDCYITVEKFSRRGTAPRRLAGIRHHRLRVYRLAGGSAGRRR